MPPFRDAFSITVISPRELTAFWPAFQERLAGLLCGQTQGLQSWLDETLDALAQGRTDARDIAEARAALDTLGARLKRVESLEGNGGALDPISLDYFLSCGAAILGAPALPASARNGAADALAVGALAADALAGASEAFGERAVLVRYGQVRGVLEGFKSLIGVLELSPSVVLGLADRDSQIIGRALALRLKLRFESASSELGHPETIIVAADSRALHAPALARIFPEQIVFAFNLHPLGAHVAPDVAGLSCAEIIFPWHLEAAETEGEAEAGESETAEAPLREASSVAAQVAATRAQNDAAWPARLEFYRAHSALLAAGNPRFARLPVLPGH